MLLIKLVTYAYTLICFASSELALNQPEDMTFVQDCLEEIQARYFNPTDFIIYFNENLNSLQLNQFPMVIQNNYSNQLFWYPPIKPNVYVVVLSEERMKETLKCLINSLHWNPRAKVIAILEGNPSNLFRAIQKYYVFNIVVLVRKSLTEIDIFTYFPYDYSKPENQRTEAVVLDTCHKGVLQKNLNLFPKKLPKRWSNTTVKVILFEYPPYLICHNCPEEKKSGIDMTIFRLIRSILDFNVSYIEKSYSSWGLKLPNGSYEQAYGDLDNHNADMGIGLFFLNYTHILDFDLTYPYIDDASKWIVPAAKYQPRWKSIAKIFSWYVWLWLAIFFLVTAFGLYFATKYIPEIKTYKRLQNCVLIYYQCLLGQPVGFLPKTDTARLGISLWLIFNCIFATAFQSQLINVLNAIIYEKQISNVEDIINSDIEFGFFPNTLQFFSNRPSSKTDSYIAANFVPCTLATSCLDRVAFKGDFATVKSKRHIHYMTRNYYIDKNGKPLVYILEDTVINVLVSMAFSTGFPMFEQTDKLLQVLRSNGIVQYYYKQLDIFASNAEKQAKKEKIHANRLNLESLQGVLGILLIGWSIAFVVFIIELLNKQRKVLKTFQFYRRLRDPVNVNTRTWPRNI